MWDSPRQMNAVALVILVAAMTTLAYAGTLWTVRQPVFALQEIVIRGPLTFELFLKSPHLVYQPSGGGHGSQESFVDRAFWQAGVERRVAVRLAHAVGISAMVSHTDLLVIVPHKLAQACANLVDVTILDLPIEIPRFNIAQYWHDRFHTDPGSRWLRGVFARLYGSRRSVPVGASLLASEFLDS